MSIPIRCRAAGQVSSRPACILAARSRNPEIPATGVDMTAWACSGPPGGCGRLRRPAGGRGLRQQVADRADVGPQHVLRFRGPGAGGRPSGLWRCMRPGSRHRGPVSLCPAPLGTFGWLQSLLPASPVHGVVEGRRTQSGAALSRRCGSRRGRRGRRRRRACPVLPAVGRGESPQLVVLSYQPHSGASLTASCSGRSSLAPSDLEV
jgi:hypothetical protein